METLALAVSPRSEVHSARGLRREGIIPAEVYGGGQKNLSVQVDYQTFRKAYRKAGENTIIDLMVGGGDAPLKVLVHDVEYDRGTGKIIHVDFVNVRMDEEVETHIPLEFTGEPEAVKALGGTLITPLSELEVRCLPAQLVHSIAVDVSSLVDFHMAIHVSDVVVPEGLTVLDDPEGVVAHVVAPRVEEVSTISPEEAEKAAVAAAAGAEGAASNEEAKS